MDKRVITINESSDIPTVVTTILGFIPEDSVTIMAVPGPVSRVDMARHSGEFRSLIAGVQPIYPHLVGHPALITVFTEHVHLGWVNVERVAGAIETNVPSASIVAHVATAKRLYRSPSDLTGVSWLPDSAAAPSREVATARADTVNDAAEALNLALEAYQAGNGALAWSFLERAQALGLNDATTERLHDALTLAVPPPGWSA